MNLKINIGTVNYTDYLRITVAKVSAPTELVYETWLNTPLANFNLVVPGLDGDNYYVSYYDAPTNIATGSLVAQLIVNGVTGETIYERRFYTVDGAGANDPSNGDTAVVDDYFVGKTIMGVFKEGFRYLEPVSEFSVTGNSVNDLTGASLSTGEKITIEIRYNVATTTQPTSGNGFYVGIVTITTVTHTLTVSDIDKRVRLAGTTTKQQLTLPALSTVPNGTGYYFDNSIGGLAFQVKLLTNGVDRILFNGFNTASNEFSEFWVSKGEHLLLRKNGSYWEVIGDYSGVNVGEMVSLKYKDHPNVLPEAGQVIDGDEYPRLWWWVNSVLPAGHKYTDANVGIGIFGHDMTRPGQFILNSNPAIKKMAMPFTLELTQKGLPNFITYNPDAEWANAFPGGFQGEQVGEITLPLYENGSGNSLSPARPAISDNGSSFQANGTLNENKQNRVDSVGVIYGVRI